MGGAGADSVDPTNCYSLSSNPGNTQSAYEAQGWEFYDEVNNPDASWAWNGTAPVLADKLYVYSTDN